MGIYIRTDDDRFYIGEATEIEKDYLDDDMIEVFIDKTLKLSVPIRDVKYIIHDLSYEAFQTLGADLKRGCVIL